MTASANQDLLDCASQLSCNRLSWQELCKQVSCLTDTPHDHLTWESWIPESMADRWQSLPVEARIGAYLVAKEASQWARSRDT